jgi:predicted DNA-binding transcriptional regulator AlpA
MTDTKTATPTNTPNDARMAAWREQMKVAREAQMKVAREAPRATGTKTQVVRRARDDDTEDILLTARKTCERYGKSLRTLNRWLNDPDLGFPRPMWINDRRHFSLAELKTWERRTAGKVG